MKETRKGLLVILCLMLLCGCGSGRDAQTVSLATPQVETDTILIQRPDDTQAPTAIPTDAATEKPIVTVTAEPPAYCVPDGVCTIAWISDPQHYSEKFPETYYAMTSFLRDSRTEMNLAYVVNTGDLVNKPEEDVQWEVADRAQAMLDGIPNGVLAGNHDVLDPVGYTAFCRYFGEARYKDEPWYGGSYEDNRGHFDLLTIGKTDYLFVYMGFGPDNQAIRWVKKIFDAYPDRVGILCLHDYYTKTQTLSKDGERWHDEVVAKCPNLYMVLCGHKYGSYCFPESFDDDRDGKEDRTVYQMLFNYQASQHDGGGGYLRLLQIDESEGMMHARTFSPLLVDFNRFDDENMRESYYPFDEKNEDFILPLPWRIAH